MNEPVELDFTRLSPAERARVDRELASAVRRLERGEDARRRRLESDAGFARRVDAIAAIPKSVKTLYADLCAEPLPRAVCNQVHREINEGTYSVETLQRCLQTAASPLRERILEAIKLREDPCRKS